MTITMTMTITGYFWCKDLGVCVNFHPWLTPLSIFSASTRVFFVWSFPDNSSRKRPWPPKFTFGWNQVGNFKQSLSIAIFQLDCLQQAALSPVQVSPSLVIHLHINLCSKPIWQVESLSLLVFISSLSAWAGTLLLRRNNLDFDE